MTVTIDEMIRDAGRELGMRRANYPKWIAAGKFGLTQEKADQQLACADAIYALLKRIDSRPDLAYLVEGPL